MAMNSYFFNMQMFNMQSPLFFFFSFFGYTSWHVGILVPQPEMEPLLPVVEL